MVNKPANKPPVSVFLATATVVFFLSLSAADSVGFVPFYIDGTEPTHPDSISLSNLPELGEEETVVEEVAPEPEVVGVLPSHMSIGAIDLDLPISNPTTRDIGKLDEMLKNGPARYVDSAKLGEKGNVLIFGHSSHLPVVHNQMYKAFNKVPDLKAGDTITIEGDLPAGQAGGKVFTYSVTSVKSVDANEGIIDLEKTGNRLTIVTCDTLTSKSARFVVEAEFVGSYDL